MTVYGYNLPIEDYRDEVLRTVAQSKVCVIKGPTGCGKSTYIPYLLSLTSAKIAVVEPRRIAVTSLYNTLSSVMGGVGYKMRFSKVMDRETKTVIYTDGSFLNEMGTTEFDYIIVDEVHERSVRTDIILGILRSTVGKIKSRIILMSATVDTEKISRYFGASVLEIPGVSHPCKIEYLDRCVSDYIVEAYCIIKRIVSRREEVWDGFETKNRDILVFLPGEEDINDLYVLLRKLPVVKVHKIFSALSDREQNRIYEASSLRRVILSTNICETSLTIPGIGYVIDSGLQKVKIYDQIGYLGIQPISRESADQRLGRCNRMGPGTCYRLYPKEMFDALPSSVPEICRSDLSQVFLQLLGHKKDISRMELVDYPPRLNAVSGLKLLLRKGCIEVVDKRKKKVVSETSFSEYVGQPDHSPQQDEDMKNIRVRITGYGRTLLRHPFDVHLAHFYQQCVSRGVGYLGSIIVSMVSQDNHNFLRSQEKNSRTDVEFLVKLFETYVETEDKRGHCTKHEVSMKGMERARQIFSTLNKGRSGDMEDLERVFSHSYQHNLCRRTDDGSYLHVESGNTVWIHPRSCFFKRQDRFIVFVDAFCTSKTYARVVGRYFKRDVEG